MNDPIMLEACYKRYIEDIGKWLPDGIVDVDLELLQQLDLLRFHPPGVKDSGLTRYFHVIEADEKLTLINDQFVIWIVPEQIDMVPVTFTLIAFNKENEVQPELGFTTSGIYNNSQLVLRLLEKFLQEIQNTQDLLEKIAKQSCK
ncbi:MAG: hypothetical protein WCG42_00610 [Parachlamydiaceae bacterium]